MTLDEGKFHEKKESPAISRKEPVLDRRGGYALKNADSVHDLLNPLADPLRPFFHPSAVAVIGATEREGSVGRSTLRNLTESSYEGRIYPVNPKHDRVLGLKAFPSITALPERVDLAVIATPAATIPALVRECAVAGVPAAVILSAGFRESGAEGLRLEEEAKAAAAGKVRLIGPNCLGLMNPAIGLNATFAQKIAQPGSVAFLSQSGALCTSILDWSLREKLGFSAFVSVGSMADVEWGALLDYFGRDPATSSIVMYMESIPDARSFLSAARAAALAKPVVVIKAGRTAAAAHAAASHTGALTGNDAVLDAAFRRVGVLRVDKISDVFHMADLLAKQPLPKGPRLAILTNAGGPGVLAADAVALEGNATLAPLSTDTLSALDAFLPKHWSHGNPIDIIGDADAERFGRTFEVVAKDPAANGILVILTPQGMTDPSAVASRLAKFAALPGKPLLASWMGGDSVKEGESILAAAGIATFPFPDDAVRAFGLMWAYRQRIEDLYETPALLETDADPGRRHEAAEILAAARKAGRLLLSEYESKKVLASYGIPVVPTELAATAEEAAEAAERMGFPVVLKVHSFTVTHKTEVGGVRLGIANRGEALEAFDSIRNAVTAKAGAAAFLGVTVQKMANTQGLELILGSSVDPQFGPVILFGAGGTMVEVFQDHALSLPPLNSNLARRLVQRTKIAKALGGFRGQAPVDPTRLASLLVRFSGLVLDQPGIAEIELNPLLASGDSLLALDARIVLHAREPFPRPAIRPYPAEYSWSWKLPEGRDARIRAVRPEDEGMVAAFHGRLTGETVEQRYGRAYELSERASHARLAKICHIDYENEIALVCVREGQIIGVARITRLPMRENAEISILVEDRWQGQGLGTELVRRLLEIAGKENIRCAQARLSGANARMRALLSRLGFESEMTGSTVVATKRISPGG